MNSNTRQWAAGLVAALALHTTVASITLWWSQHPSPPETPLPAMLVDMTPEPAAPPTPPEALPPGPPQPAQEAVRPKARPIAKRPSPPIPAVSDVAPIPVPEPAPITDTPAETENTSESDAALASAPPSVDAPAGAQAAGRQALSSQGQARVANWQGVLLAHLERYRHYPRQAQRDGRQGVSHVRIKVDTDGKILDWRIVRSSGHPVLDEAALDTIHRANPVPPPPAELANPTVEAIIPVDFFIRRAR